MPQSNLYLEIVTVHVKIEVMSDPEIVFGFEITDSKIFSTTKYTAGIYKNSIGKKRGPVVLAI